MQPCSVCTSPQRAEIDRLLVERVPLRRIAERSGTSVTALHRHGHAHVAQGLVKAKEANEIAEANSLLGRVEQLMSRSERIAGRAERAKQWSPAVAALREVRACLELLAELQGELKRTQNNNVYVSLGITSREELEAQLKTLLLDLFSRNLIFAKSFAQNLLREVEERERGILEGS